MVILLIFAFISGLVTILAPCIWPLLPIILSTTSTGGNRKPLGITLGILVSFGALTLALTYLVRVFHFDPDTLRIIAVIVLMILGISLVIPKIGTWIEVVVSRLGNLIGSGRTENSGFWGGFITGLSLGVVWAPCAGPILATIAALAATARVNSEVILVTLFYVLGTGIPLFIFASVGRNWLTKSATISPYLGKIQQFFGIVIIVTALGIFTNYDKVVEARLLSAVPAYSDLLFKLEQTRAVRGELSRLQGKQGQSVTVSRSFLPDLGPASDFVGINNWLNSQPLKLADLKGKVVLVDFWTYTCINCIRTLPFVTGWYEKYKDQGFVVVGVHTPEFEFEKKTENVARAIKMFGINYPVAQDNNYSTWNNFNNNFWPADYLIDANGHLRETHFGEGAYPETEKAIQSLLAEVGKPMPASTLSLADQTPKVLLTPETYLGTKRMERFASKERAITGTQKYSLPDRIPADNFAYEGGWTLDPEFAQSSSGSVLVFNFDAEKVFLVITPLSGNDDIRVLLDGKPIDSVASGKDVTNSKIKLDEPRLYELINLKGKGGKHLLRLEFGTDGTKVFAFTFG